MGEKTRKDIYQLMLSKSEIDTSKLDRFLNHEDSFVRSATAQALGKVNKRQVYEPLIKLMRDKDVDVVGAAIIAAANTKDTRFLFPLINLYNNRDGHEIKVHVLNALSEIKDPRSIDFLKELKETDLQNVVENCLKSQDISKRFVYTFTGTDEEKKQGSEDKFRIQIKKTQDFYTLAIYPPFKKITRKTQGNFGPLTYIVDEKGRLFITGKIEEHVHTARGEKVLTAGEMIVELPSFEIIEINNRSNGYYPARTTYNIIGSLLDHFKIKHPGKFTYEHPRDGFFSDDFLSLFPLHPEYEKKIRKRKKN